MVATKVANSKADYTHNIHNFQHESFPKAKMPLDKLDHPDHHVHSTGMEHGKPVESTVEKPQTTRTGKSKRPKFPFQGKNS
jgi:hypothetical protein